MKSFSNMPYYSTSFITHLVVLLVVIAISSYRTKLIPVFQTSVVFEQAKSKKAVRGKRKTLTSENNKEIPQRYNTKQKKPETETEKLPTSVNASEIFGKSDHTKRSELIGFLRANKKTEKLKTSQNRTTKNKDEKLLQKDASAPLFSGHKYASATTSKSDSDVDRPEKSGPINIWKKKNELVSYRKVLRSIVRQNWVVPPVALKEFEIRIKAIIDSNGNLLDLHLIQGSGLIILNSAAERAIRVSTPFGKVPKSILNNNKEFHATFRFTPNEVSN